MEAEVTLPVVSLDDALEAPRYAKEGDAGLDLRAAESTVLQPGQRQSIPCGIKMAIPEGFAGLVIPRSGLAARHGITVLNAPGLIDSGYRGEVCVVLLNTDPKAPFSVEKGDRIAQLMIVRAPHVSIEDADQLDITSRGESGFGSSGI